MKKTNIVLEEKKEAGRKQLGAGAKIRSYDMPTYEITLPEVVINALGVNPGDTINFFTDDTCRVYLEKA